MKDKISNTDSNISLAFEKENLLIQNGKDPNFLGN